MRKQMMLYYVGSGGSGGGIKKAPNATARLALTPADGDFVIQLDTDTLYYYNVNTWEVWGTDQDHTLLTTHLNPATSSVHNAPQITFSQSTWSSTNVHDGIVEAFTKAAAALAAHTGQAVAAHAASAISVVPSGNLVETDVQSALFDQQAELDTLTAASHAAATVGAFGATPNSNGLAITGQAISLEPADATHPGAVSTAQQDLPGQKSFAAGVLAGATGAINGNAVFQVKSTTKGSMPLPVMTAAQMATLAALSPTEGMMVYNSDNSMPYVFNGLNFEPLTGYAVPAATTVADGGTLSLTKYSKQIQRVGGNGGSATITLTHTLLFEGFSVRLMGTDDTNPVQIVTAANVVLNGTLVLGLNDYVDLVKIGTVLYEVGRSE